MGNSTSQPDARSLRAELEGLSVVEQHRYAFQWAKSHDCVIDLFGDYARDLHLVLFRSGGSFIISDARPKNVLVSETGAVFVIDADVAKI